MTAGLSVAAKAVNSELQDLGFAIRSLDQSCEIPATQSCGAYTAGSRFKQEPVEKSLAILCDIARKAEQADKEEASKSERLEKQIQKKRDADRKKKKENDA
mgnify:CR=1 FL=1